MAGFDFEIKENDRSPSYQDTLTSGGGAVDLTGASVKFLMRDREETEDIKVDASATIVDADTGVVRYDWAAGDTDTPGVYIAEWEVTLLGKKSSYPGDRYLLIRVLPEIA